LVNDTSLLNNGTILVRRGKEEKLIVKVRRVRLYDALALLTAMIVVALDQWTKAWVVAHLVENGPAVPLVGNYLSLYYIRNNGAAFSLFANSIVLVAFIVLAIGVVLYLYLRTLNTANLGYKLIFGLIIGGAVGNLIDRARHSGYVVDFISFRIPQIGFNFAIFNLADAAISVGVFLLFVAILFGNLRKPRGATQRSEPAQTTPSARNSGVLRSSKEHDAQT